MENEEKRVWGIHTKDDHLFLVDNRIAIEWKPIGNLSKIEATRAAFKDKYIEVYPNAKKGAIPTSSGMLYRFMYEMQVGDYVVFPFKSDRKINIGIVESDYIYEPTALEYVQQRKVKWIKHLPRTFLGRGLILFNLCSYGARWLTAHLRQSQRLLRQIRGPGGRSHARQHAGPSG